MMIFGFLMMVAVIAIPLLLIALLVGGSAGIFQRWAHNTGSPTSSYTPVQPTSNNIPDHTPATKYCSHCGAGLKADWTHCPQCGAPVE